MKNYYQILDVKFTATKDEIKKNYRQLALKFHPDRNPNNKEAEEQFKKIVEAYEVLSNDEKRNKYNIYLHQEEERIKQEQRVKEAAQRAKAQQQTYNSIINWGAALLAVVLIFIMGLAFISSLTKVNKK